MRVRRCAAEKSRELGTAQSEIKSPKAAEVLKDKAIEEVTLLVFPRSNSSLPLMVARTGTSSFWDSISLEFHGEKRVLI